MRDSIKRPNTTKYGELFKINSPKSPHLGQPKFITIQIPMVLSSTCNHNCKNQQFRMTSNMWNSVQPHKQKPIQTINDEHLNFQNRLANQIKLERQRSCNLQRELKLFRMQNQKLLKEKERLLKKQRNTINSEKEDQMKEQRFMNTPNSLFSIVNSSNSSFDQTIEVSEAVENIQNNEVRQAQTIQVDEHAQNLIQQNINQQRYVFNCNYWKQANIKNPQINFISNKHKNKMMSLKTQINDLQKKVKEIKQHNVNFYNQYKSV